jgi:hypothetical protein
MWLAMALVGCLALATIVPMSAGGQAELPKGDVAGWRQVVAEGFDEDVAPGAFTTSAYVPRLFPYQGYDDTFGHGTYEPNQVLSVHDGLLDWHLHSAHGVTNVAAVVVTVPNSQWGQTYGRYSVRFRSDIIPGYKLAFLLWPDSDRWGEGEIDFPEANSLASGGEVVANVYEVGAEADRPGPSTGFATGVPVAGSGWHVATTEWSQAGLTFTLDDEVLGTKTVGVPATPMHWVLQVETSQNAPEAATSGHVQVDWVAAYAPE